MGPNSSTDKALGNVVNTVTKGAKTVATDQVSKWQDYYEHPFSMILPTVIGVMCIITSFVIYFTTCKEEDKRIKKDAMNDTTISDDTDDNTMVCSSNILIPNTFLIVGILMIVIVQFILTVRHPRASAEEAVASMILR